MRSSPKYSIRLEADSTEKMFKVPCPDCHSRRRPLYLRICGGIHQRLYLLGVAYIHQWDPGDISVEYNVTGTDIMDTIGACKVTVYQALGSNRDAGRDKVVANYWHEVYPDMMTTNSVVYSHSIRLRVDMGMRYYAVLVFYATLNGGGDDMAYCTSTVST